MARRRWLDEADIGIILVMVFIFVAVALPFFFWTALLGIAGCDDGCDITTAWSTALSFFVLDGIVFALVVPLYTLRARQWERTWWVPAAGIAVLLIGALIAYIAIRIAIPTP